jgi:type I restriction enzyme, S subunit
VHQNHIIKVRSARVLPSWYLLVWCTSPLGREQFRRVASSTAGLHILSIGKVQALPVPVPPAAELVHIKAAFEQMDSRVAVQRVAVRAENKSATALRHVAVKKLSVNSTLSSRAAFHAVFGRRHGNAKAS